MANKHSYAASTINTSIVLGIIALVSALSSIGFLNLTNIWIKNLGLEELFKTYGWLVSPLTITGFYSLYFLAYEHFLWKYASGIPCLTGTWIGFTVPNYQEWAHLLVMKVDQTWSDISIVIYVYYKNSASEEWKEPLKKLGIDNSITAYLSGKSNNQVDITIAYQHSGLRPGKNTNDVKILYQPNFPGTVSGNVSLERNQFELSGTMYTNRYNQETGQFGSNGILQMIQISKSHLKPEKILDYPITKEVIEKLEKEITSQ